MEYYILINEQKQGPFDLISMIKKVKNGSLTQNSMVSHKIEGPFREAAQIDEVAEIINEHSNPTAGNMQASNVQMTLKASFLEGIELWMRRILDYTLIAGAIIALGRGVQIILKPAMAEDSAMPAYLSTILMMSLFFQFCYYVLETKRSQEIELRNFVKLIKKTMLPFIGLAAVLSSFILLYGIGNNFGLVATLIGLVAITLLIFTPFIANDSNMNIIKSAKLSVRKVLSMGADNFGVILSIVAINLFAAILPGLIMKDLLGLGLFISLPITISALAYIYDQVFV